MRRSAAAPSTNPNPCALRLALSLSLLAALSAAPVGAQLVRGTVVDASNGQPVALTAVSLLDRERDHVVIAMSDSLGRYFLEVPDSGEYMLLAQRFGYMDMESPLLAISDDRDYALDLELRPAPLGLAGIDVTVSNERVIDWLKLELGVNPAAAFGFRLLQGARLDEAKLRGKLDPTNTLRFLYIPIWHRGECVVINSVPRAERTTWWSGNGGGAFAELGAPPVGTRSGAETTRSREETRTGSEGAGCGSLMVNDRVVPNEHIDSIDMSNVAVVVTFFGQVRMYTYDFNWTFRGR